MLTVEEAAGDFIKPEIRCCHDKYKLANPEGAEGAKKLSLPILACKDV